MAEFVIAAVTLALAYGLLDLIWCNRSLTRMLHAALGAALACIFIFDQWHAGLILGAIGGAFLLPINYFEALAFLPPDVLAPALGIGLLSGSAVYILLRMLNAEPLAIAAFILVFTGLSSTLANRWNAEAIAREAQRMGLDVIFIRDLNDISGIDGGPPHACAVLATQAFGWSYSDYSWYPAPYTWRCANPHYHLDYENG